jgi:hypothetical protein
MKLVVCEGQSRGLVCLYAGMKTCAKCAGITVAEEINALHGKLIHATRTSLEDAILIGKKLTEQKSKLKNGEWFPWFDSNIRFSLKTADRYRAIYKDRDKFVAMANLDIIDARRLLSGAAPEAAHRPFGA